MKKLRPLIAGLIIVGSVTTWWFLRDPAQEGVLRASGTVEVTEAHLGFPGGGTLLQVVAEEGDVVRQGDVLAVLDTARLSARHRSATAGVRSAQARLNEAMAGARPEERASAQAAARAAAERHEQALRDVERLRELFEGGAVSRQRLEQAETALAVAVAGREQAERHAELVEAGPRQETISALRAGLEAAQAAEADLATALRDATLRAPFDGLVTDRHREPGEITGPAQPVITLQAPSNRWVRIFIPEFRMEDVSVGQTVTILSDGRPDDPFSGTIRYLGTEAEFTPRNVQTQEDRMKLVYPARVSIDNDPDLELKPGLPVDVLIENGDDVSP